MAQTVNETELQIAVLRYQETKLGRDAEIVLHLADPLIRGMLGRAATAFGLDLEESRCKVQFKIWKALSSYRPESGRIFSYLNATVQNHTRSLCNEHIKNHERWVAFTDLAPAEESENLEASINPWRSAEALEDIQHKLCSLRTLCTRENELRAQKWLVRGLIQSEFSIPRHEAVKALRIVFNVDLKTGRLVHDKTILELRRVMLNGRQHFPPINVCKLRDKRERGLLKFRPYVSQENFDKLVYLMRNLAPIIISDQIEKETRSLNGEGTPERKRAIIREQLNFAIDGYPNAVPLFSK
jgi:hypothetical protein